MKRKTCTIIGLGYIGLPTALILSDNGFNVNGFDINQRIINGLKDGRLHIKEKGLNELFVKVKSKNSFIPSSELKPSDTYIIAVPTPVLKKNKIVSPDIRFLENAVLTISKIIKKDDLVIIESTVPVGTTRRVSEMIFEKTGLSYEDVNYAYCPERVLPGNIINELLNNDRVIGGLTKKSLKKASELYSSFCRGKLIFTSSICAELVKLSENAFRDVNIAFANELSIICEKLGVDVSELISIANHHPRVNILKPGCGVGGHCIAVDPWFLVSSFPEDSLLIKLARKVNLRKTSWVIDKIKKVADEFEIKNKKKPIIGCLGLSFKPNIDDLRESPALEIFNQLNHSGLSAIACEPNLKKHISIKLYSLSEIESKADIIIKLVDHKEFQDMKKSIKEVYDFCK